jgi:hypothetical protein
MEKTIVGMSLSNLNEGILEDGLWKVSVKLIESRTYSDGTKDEEIIEALCMDSDHLTAHEVALRSAMSQYGEEVYNKGLTSLVEARKKYGKPIYGNLTDKDTIAQ